KEMKNKIMIIIILSLIGMIFFVFNLFYLLYPKYLCNKWGGSLANSGHCYPLDDMDRCIDNQGNIRQLLSLPVNFTKEVKP
ncbi:MAG: hypothetical protein ACFFG0_19955, partial [Candidatus Thorarchaeota archaeon]